MGRDIGAACKLCRREGMKLFIKGERCFSGKCAVERGRPAPGMHGKRRSKLSDYGQQLREKQRLRRSFGMREGQFRNFFKRAVRTRGITGEKLLQMLELRLDNITYRLGFAPSRRAARQLVLHGHIQVNGRKATIGSMVLTQGDVVELRDRHDMRKNAELNLQNAEARGLVPWLSLNKNLFKGEILQIPRREEINSPFNEQLVVELYSK